MHFSKAMHLWQRACIFGSGHAFLANFRVVDMHFLQWTCIFCSGHAFFAVIHFPLYLGDVVTMSGPPAAFHKYK